MAVRAVFPPEPTAYRPWDFDEVDDAARTISYAYKSFFERRSSYVKDGERNVKGEPLKARDWRELLRFLDRHPMGARLLLHGVRRYGKPFKLQPTCRRSKP